MRKVNLTEIAETEDKSPKGKYHSFYKGVSLALGRDDTSRDLDKRHPFDLEYMRLPAGATNYPYHSHSAQWEFYVVVAGDAFLFQPTEAHQISNPGPEDLVYYVIADNPIGECCYYPDSKKWLVARETSLKKLVPDGQVKYYEDEE
jgi:uncharacterized cupin superfamily protein